MIRHDVDRKHKQGPLSATDMPSPESFNNYFANLGKQKHSLITEPPLGSLTDVSCPNTLHLSPTDPREIYQIIMSLKNSNAAGYDGIAHRVVRHCAAYISYPLSEVINSSLSEGLFPQELKQSQIRPIFKDGDCNLPENWRPIANVSTFSKIYEHVFTRRLIDFVLHNNLLCTEQFGFVKGKNTTDAMVDYVTKAITALDEKNKAVGVFLDLQKAFDCLDHSILFDKLYSLGLRGVSLDWIKSFLQSRHQRVHVNNPVKEY